MIMTNFILNLELLSDTLIGSGEGWGANIDTDVVFDDVGLPYIPARRIKGCLRESAVEVMEMFKCLELEYATSKDIDVLFGKTGQSQSSLLSFSNCYLSDYESNRKWLKWISTNDPDFSSKEAVLGTFTSLRQQTAIDEEGIAKEHFLRTSRVLRKGIAFFGNIESSNEMDDRLLSFLVLAAVNMRYIGTNRNRGFGSIRSTLSSTKAESLNEKYLNILEDKIMGV